MKHIMDYGVKGLADEGIDETTDVHRAIVECSKKNWPLDWGNLDIRVHETLGVHGQEGVRYSWLNCPTLNFDLAGDYTPILEGDGGATGKNVCLDLAGTINNSFGGHLTLRSTSPMGNWKKASRTLMDDTPLGDMVGLSVSKNGQYDGHESTAEKLIFKVLGEGMRAPGRGDGAAYATPFTGWDVRAIKALICGRAAVMATPNGADDVSVGSLRIERCGKGSGWTKSALFLKGTGFSTQEFFLSGFRKDDYENPRITAALGSTDFTLNSAFGFEAGDWFAVPNDAGSNTPGVVNQVVEDLGTAYRCAYPFPRAVNNERFVWEPPVGLNAQNGWLNTQTFYPEGVWLAPVIIGEDGRVVWQTLHFNGTGLHGACVHMPQDRGSVIGHGGPVLNELEAIVALWRVMNNDGAPAKRETHVWGHQSEDAASPIILIDEPGRPSALATGGADHADAAAWALTKDRVKIDGDPVDLQA